MQRRIESGLVIPSTRVEPVALQHAVVERRVRILVGRIGAVERPVRSSPILLMPVGLEHRTVLTVAERHVLAGAQGDRREFHVGRRERGIAVVRDAVETTRIRQQAFAVLVEHVLLLVEEAFDGETVDCQIGSRVQPAANGVERDGEQLWIEPGAGLLLPREEDLHLLATSIDLVVALILVVLKSGEIPDAVAQRTHVVHCAKRCQQLVRTRG